MIKYFLRRLAMIIPTLLGVTIVVFVIINMAPGGPIEQKLQQMRFATRNKEYERVYQNRTAF